jgi:hypothetical protein
MSSFSAGLIADTFGYAATFVMAVCALGVAAITGRFVFAGVEIARGEPARVEAGRAAGAPR